MIFYNTARGGEGQADLSIYWNCKCNGQSQRAIVHQSYSCHSIAVPLKSCDVPLHNKQIRKSFSCLKWAEINCMCICTTYLGRSQLLYWIFTRSHIEISNWVLTVQTHLRGSFCSFVLEHDLSQCNLMRNHWPSVTIDQWRLLPSFLEHFIHLYMYV